MVQVILICVVTSTEVQEILALINYTPNEITNE